MALYTDKVMDYFRNPRHMGKLEDANAVGEVGNVKCGDIMTMYLKIEDNIIKDAGFETFGCGSAIAASSMATEMIIGKTLEDALKVTNKDVVAALEGLPAHKIHCSVLAEESIHDAIANYVKENEGASTLVFDSEQKSCCHSTCGGGCCGK